MTRADVYMLIIAERIKQIEVKGYDAEHDAGHDPLAWAEKLEHEIGCVFRRTVRSRTGADLRAGLVKIAAVAVAALETLPAPAPPEAGGE